MACRERSSLWAYATGELGAAEREEIAAHLAVCDECRGELQAIEATRQVLALASEAEPQVDWRRADEQVKQAAARRMARLELRWPFSPLGIAAAAAAVIALLFAVDLVRAPSRNAPVAEAPADSGDRAIAEVARGAHLAGIASPIADGAAIGAGEEVSTPDDGRAVLKLPDGSRVRVARASQLKLSRIAKDDVRLAVGKGRVAIKAAHAERKGFVVEAAGARVRVVGTAFTVALGERELEVGVAEGGVVVETGDGRERLLQAGERAIVDRATWQIRLVALDPLADELAEIGVEAKAPPAAPLPPSPPARQPGLAARPAPPAPAPSPAAPAPVPPISSPASLARRASPAPSPEPALGPIPVEEFFLRRAEAARARGECGRFQEGLSAYLEEAADPESRERARWLRARCFLDLRMSVEADAEMRRYLREFPDGAHAGEARRVVAH